MESPLTIPIFYSSYSSFEKYYNQRTMHSQYYNQRTMHRIFQSDKQQRQTSVTSIRASSMNPTIVLLGSCLSTPSCRLSALPVDYQIPPDDLHCRGLVS